MGIAKFGTHTFQSGVVAGETPVGTPLNVEGYSVAGFQIVSLGTGTVQWEATLASEAGTITWVAVRATNVNDGVAGTTASASGIFTLDVRAFIAIRARITTLSIVSNGALSIFGTRQAEVT